MKVLVVGLGSMGKRRIRLMKQYDDTIEIIGVDANAKRAQEVQKEFLIKVLGTIKDAAADGSIDCGFVCTSPLSHCAIINELLSYNLCVFTEINLVSDGYENFADIQEPKLFLSSTFLYRKDVSWMIDKVKGQKVNYIYHTGQYLPDWHPWENYENFFVGDKRTNGCREILAIELPWITECFGRIQSFTVLKDKMTNLKIDYPDNYYLQIQHENGNKGLLAVDVVARKAMRRMEIFNEQLQVFWDGTPDSLQEWDIRTGQFQKINTYDDVVKDRNYCENIIENAYMDEIDAFFTWVNGDIRKVRYDFKRDAEILQLIDEIEVQE